MNYFCQFQRSLPNRSGGLRRCILGTEVFFSIYLHFLFSFSISYLFIFLFLPFQNFPMPCPQPSLPSFRRKHKFSTKFFVSTLLFLFLITIIIVLQWNKVHQKHHWCLNCSHCHKKNFERLFIIIITTIINIIMIKITTWKQSQKVNGSWSSIWSSPFPRPSWHWLQVIFLHGIWWPPLSCHENHYHANLQIIIMPIFKSS